MDLVDRKEVIETIRRGWGHYPTEQAIMAILGVAVVPLADLLEAKARIRQIEEERLKAVPDFKNEVRGGVPGRFGYWKRKWQE